MVVQLSVDEALDNAIKHGHPEIRKMSATRLCQDLIRFSPEFEDRTISVILPYVTDWLDKNKPKKKPRPESVLVTSDPRWNLLEWQSWIQEKIRIHGLRSILYTDAGQGHANIGLFIEERE